MGELVVLPESPSPLTISSSGGKISEADDGSSPLYTAAEYFIQLKLSKF
jgi:hypothetical protein